MIQKPKGTKDIFGLEGKQFIYLQNLISDICDKYNYNFIKTPTYEHTELFHRSVGETTDIVTKETYDFKDRSDREITLKPEGTAGVIRSFIENKMYANSEQPVKLYYFSSAFRYERPQSGRLREHTQFGVEVLGNDNPLIDAEIISLAVNILKVIGLKNVIVKINSLGDSESRKLYNKKLVDYFKPRINELCEDCQKRLNKNPLRILDCKVDINHELMIKCPKVSEYLNEDSVIRFNKVKEYLDALEIDYEVDNNLVRGLDYYCHTVFEIQADIDGFGSQNTICGGGRYNNLVESLDGPETPGMGFGMGLERLILAINCEEINLFKNDRIDLYVANLSEEPEEVYSIIDSLRMQGYKIETDYQNRKLTNQFKSIDRLNPKYFVIIGDDELKSGKVKIKDNDTKEEVEMDIFDISDYLNLR